MNCSEIFLEIIYAISNTLKTKKEIINWCIEKNLDVVIQYFIENNKYLAELSVCEGLQSLACTNGNVTVLKFALNKESINKDLYLLCAEKGYLELMKYYDSLKPLDITDNKPLNAAMLRNQNIIIEYLLDKGMIPDKSYVSYFSRDNPLFLRLLAFSENINDIVKYGDLELFKKVYSKFKIEETLKWLITFRKMAMLKFYCENTELSAYEIPLEVAVEMGDVEIVEFLFALEYDLSFKIEKSLELAINYSHLEIVKFLTNTYFDVSAILPDKISYACSVGSIKVVEYLFEKAKELDIMDVILYENKCRSCDQEITKLLIEVGFKECEVSSKTEFGHISLLDIFRKEIENGRSDNVLSMLKRVENKDLYIHELLIAKKYQEIITFLKSADFPKKIFTSAYKKMYSYIYSRGKKLDISTMEYFKDYLDLRTDNDYFLRTSTDIEIIKYLIKNGADIDSGYNPEYDTRFGYEGDSVVERCIKNDNLELAKYFIEIKIPIKRILNIAVKNNSLSIIKYLHKLGVKMENIIVSTYGIKNAEDTINYLLDNNIDFAISGFGNLSISLIKKLLVKFKDNKELFNTFFGFYYQRGNIKMSKYFIDKGANWNEGFENDTYDACPTKVKYPEITKYLILKGKMKTFDNSRVYSDKTYHMIDKSNITLVKFFIDHLKINIYSAISSAIFKRNLVFIKYFKKIGKDVDCKNDLYIENFLKTIQ